MTVFLRWVQIAEEPIHVGSNNRVILFHASGIVCEKLVTFGQAEESTAEHGLLVPRNWRAAVIERVKRRIRPAKLAAIRADEPRQDKCINAAVHFADVGKRALLVGFAVAARIPNAHV